ncbi:MAG: hypothetical protein K2I19_02440 [Muribaculaceae bacterium]|nr:hypothetical protein [Muribaculaceae bacterium]
MKAILCDKRSLAMPLPAIRLIADSAIGRQREPYWLDTDSGLSYTALICPCYRVGRLGKNIDRKFAARYIDALTPAAVILPSEYAAAPMEAPEIFFASTNALIPGDDTEFAEAAIHTIEAAGKRLEFQAGDFIGEAVARLTGYMTIKNGDRLIDCSHAIAVQLCPRGTVEATLDGLTVLKFKAH